MTSLLFAMGLFVGLHFLMSHPLRRPMVETFGERGFLGIYSLISFATLIWAVLAYSDTVGEQLWIAPTWAYPVAHIVMLFASILFVGSFAAPNPALVMADGQLSKIDAPGGAMRITRHPMMWSMALWAFVHIFLAGRSDTLVFAGGIAFLALVGAAAQDAKKRRLIGDAWAEYTAKTTYWPTPAWPGLVPVIGGLVLYGALVFLHPVVMGRSTWPGVF